MEIIDCLKFKSPGAKKRKKKFVEIETASIEITLQRLVELNTHAAFFFFMACTFLYNTLL